jgi:hypothetical protein
VHPWQPPPALIHRAFLNRLAVTVEQTGLGGERSRARLCRMRQREQEGRYEEKREARKKP